MAEDLLTAEELAQVLESAGIPVLTLDGRGGTVDVLTTGVVNDWWELRVPSRDVARAQVLVTETRQRLLATRAEAEQAAEEEALAGIGGSGPLRDRCRSGQGARTALGITSRSARDAPSGSKSATPTTGHFR